MEAACKCRQKWKEAHEMIKKVFRPFWSYDVQKTEDWLHEMALKGYLLKNINPVTRVFIFGKDNNAADIRYHIEYAKSHPDTVPAALQDDGWERVTRARKWYVLCNKQPTDKRRTFPVRDGIIRRNRLMLYLFGGLSVYTAFTSLFFIVMLGLMTAFDYSVTIQANAFWAVALIIGIVFWALGPYSVIRLYKTNHKYW